MISNATQVGALPDGDALTALRTATRTGYVLVGPHDRICRHDPTGRDTGVVDIGRHENDTVQALLVAGLLRLDTATQVLDHGTRRRGYPLAVTRHGQHVLDHATHDPAERRRHARSEEAAR
jgi:hypothetical protein